MLERRRLESQDDFSSIQPINEKSVIYSTIKLENKNGIATVTVCRPEALNALNSITLEELSNVFDRIAQDENIRVLILTGSGEKRTSPRASSKPSTWTATPHTARMAQDQALAKVIQHLLKDDTQVYKQFVKNESFKRFVGDMVYAITIP
jgi:hypothetical protein